MPEENRPEVDVPEMPCEGIAAYWLSLKKVMGNKLSASMLSEELDNTSAPFVTFLLDICLSSLPEASARGVCRARAGTVLAQQQLKLKLVKEALLAISIGENPRMTSLRLSSLVPHSRVASEQSIKYALDMIRVAEKSKDGYLVTIDSALDAERLMVKLMFYVLWARRESPKELESFAEQGTFGFFNHGLAMVVDGHDRSFIKSCLDHAQEETLAVLERRMTLAWNMALGLKYGMGYDDLFRVAKAYLD